MEVVNAFLVKKLVEVVNYFFTKRLVEVVDDLLVGGKSLFPKMLTTGPLSILELKR